MSLGCARCGSCCDPVYVNFGVWTRAVADARRYGPEDAPFALDEQWLNCVHLAANCRPIGVEGEDVLLECRFYDREHRACGAYAQRPEMCSGFPWYGREPPGRANLPAQCSYLLDVPPSERRGDTRPLIPLTVLRG